MTLPHLERDFPNLAADGYEKTSDPTWAYNCIGYAVGDEMHWWQPAEARTILGFRTYWPQGVPRQETIRAYELALATKGFRRCPDGTPEDGYEKVALYVAPGDRPKHAARRRLDDGRWASKCGPHEDIAHNTLKAVEGTLYGKPRLYFRRELRRA